MYKCCLFLPLLIIASMAFGADDACTKPKEFKIDRRCYVTNEQKKNPPFNATVALIDNNYIYCTGTIVKGFNGYQDTIATEQDKDTVFIYTAKHCVINKYDMVQKKLKIRLQNDSKIYTPKLAYVGNYESKTDEHLDGDWAIYTMPNIKKDIPYTLLSKKENSGDELKLNASIIGYGTLKIMSDAEITKFKEKYSDFLKAQGQEVTGIEDEGVNTISTFGKQFMEYLENNDSNYYYDLFNNQELKVSECKYSSSGKKRNCQAWCSNSGCGIFDADHNLMGIATRSALVIGGPRHAGAGISDKTSSIPIAF